MKRLFVIAKRLTFVHRNNINLQVLRTRTTKCTKNLYKKGNQHQIADNPKLN